MLPYTELVRDTSTAAAEREQLGREVRPGVGDPGMTRRSSSHLAPAISLNSCVLGFLIGCFVFYALHCTGSVDICIGCETDRAPLPYPPPYIAIHQPRITQISRVPSPTTTATGATRLHTGDRCPGNQLQLMVLILSAPNGSLRRNAIRGTWLHDTSPELVKLNLRFLIGTRDLAPEQLNPLSSEDEMFHDILFLPDHKEAYSNLTAKVLLGLVWADKNLEFDYLVKADDDSYVRIIPLVSALRKLKCPTLLYWGYFIGHAVPETAGRWAEKHWTICPHYLPYAMGGGYVLAREVVRLIGRFHHHFKLYSNEDVSLGSWLAPFHVTYVHDLRFNTEAASHGCSNDYIISHKEKVRGLYEKYVNIKKNGTMCSEEKEIRPAYIYNWTAASPLECCERSKGIPVPGALSITGAPL